MCIYMCCQFCSFAYPPVGYIISLEVEIYNISRGSLLPTAIARDVEGVSDMHQDSKDMIEILLRCQDMSAIARDVQGI